MTQAGHPGWLAWLETTGAATAMRQSLWLYPVVEILHILGFVVLVGSAAMFDLRLLGLSRQLPVTGMERHLLPWARAAVLVIVPTGALMFVAHATEFAGNPAFRLEAHLAGDRRAQRRGLSSSAVPAGRRVGSGRDRSPHRAIRGGVLAGAVDRCDRLRAAPRLLLTGRSATRGRVVARIARVENAPLASFEDHARKNRADLTAA